MNADELFNRETEVFVFPASFAQQRLWFLHRLAPGNPFYNVSTALRLTGSLNSIALEQTFNEIVRRHEILRTTFAVIAGELSQIIASELTLSIPKIDLQNIPESQQEREHPDFVRAKHYRRQFIRDSHKFTPGMLPPYDYICETEMHPQETAIKQLAIAESQIPFDLAKGPLLRVKLLQFSATEYVLLLNFHHIVADGWSIAVLIRELTSLYKAFAKNQLSPLPELPIQYADFAEWQHQWLQGEVLETQLAYWRQQLTNIQPLNLPVDRPRPPVPSYRGAREFLALSPTLSDRLNLLSKQQNVTLFVTLLAAFQTLLYRYTGQENIALGTPIANRNRRELEGLIGFFVNTLVLRTDLSGNPIFMELLNRAKQVSVAAYAHQDLPFEKLVEALEPDRDLSRNPLFQISFSLQNTPAAALELPELTWSAIDFDAGTAKLDLEFNLWEDFAGIKGQLTYSTDLFDSDTIARMLEHFQTLLESIVANPNQRLSDLPILTPASRHQILVEFNRNSSQIIPRLPPISQENEPESSNIALCFHQLFELQVERSPDAIALVFENQHLTYRQLNTKANQIAHYLQQLGVKPEVLVGICMDRCLDAIAGLLGILKAGGAYVPLDPNYPQERLNFMLKDARTSILLTAQQHLPRFTPKVCQIPNLAAICLDRDSEAIARQSPQNPTSPVTVDNLAYVIYTSGSTGKPKGVLIEHKGLSNLAQAQIETFKLQPNHRVLQFASLSFDASIFEIVLALRSGATLYLANPESRFPGKPLIDFVRDNAISHVTLPPAVLKLLPTTQLAALQTIICAGESCTPELVKTWGKNRQFFNAYGPTEVTVWASISEINDSQKISIGRPILHTQIYILDQNLQPVPIGIPGEIHISGLGVARGYLNRSHLTPQRFIPNPLSDRHKVPMYKTGDLARYLPDGNIEFLGRIDEQVKVRGFRIELGEIEAVLRQHPGVKETCAIACNDSSGNQHLIAYVVPKNPRLNPLEIRNLCKAQLPPYMMPNAFQIIDNLPLTPNGKIDRRRLSSPENLTATSGDAFAEPRSPTESTLAQIWAATLNRDRVGIRDNFFDLGGDSLLAVRLIDRINQQFQRDLPLSSLFLNPTVELLANTLSLGKNSLTNSPLVAINSQGSKPPFFCVHPIFGVVFPYYKLAAELGRDQPFYALQPRGIEGECSPLTSIEDMAAFYIAAVREVQPQGPYFLGGWSFGGLVAFEMAQQLQKAGDTVALLAILDTLAPIPANQISFWDGCKFLLTTALGSVWPFLLDYFRLLAAADHFSGKSLIGRIAQLNKVIQPIFRVFQANSKATLAYAPPTYDNQITLVRSTSQTTTGDRDFTLGWNQLTTDKLEVIRVPGNHLTMLRIPYVQVLAQQLKQFFISIPVN
ncbi:amino acid adenylation domain-containing protein [Microcoleus sp.]|uniref:non-ribosomal peptide synthetase n=1 Tax=Microcoleus sp. TaxID=44472 RepID=UPI0035261E87